MLLNIFGWSLKQWHHSCWKLKYGTQLHVFYYIAKVWTSNFPAQLLPLPSKSLWNQTTLIERPKGQLKEEWDIFLENISAVIVYRSHRLGNSAVLCLQGFHLRSTMRTKTDVCDFFFLFFFFFSAPIHQQWRVLLFLLSKTTPLSKSWSVLSISGKFLDDDPVKMLWCSSNGTVMFLTSPSSRCFIPLELIHSCRHRGTDMVFKNSSFEAKIAYIFLFKISFHFYNFNIPMAFKHFLLKFASIPAVLF